MYSVLYTDKQNHTITEPKVSVNSTRGLQIWHQTTAPNTNGVPFLYSRPLPNPVIDLQRLTTDDRTRLHLITTSHLPAETAPDTPLTLCDGANTSDNTTDAVASVDDSYKNIKDELAKLDQWLSKYV